MNREMRRMLAKQMKPMKDPVKEDIRVKWTSEITKDAIKEVFGIVKNVVPKPDITKKSRKFCGAIKGWVLHKLK